MLDKNSIFPLILSTIAGLSTVLGAVIVFFTKNRNERFLTFALGFSAGVMITVSFTDLFPTAENAISKYHGKVSGILKDLSKNSALIIATHDIEFLYKTCNRVIYLDDKVIKEDFYLNIENKKKVNNIFINMEGK